MRGVEFLLSDHVIMIGRQIHQITDLQLLVRALVMMLVGAGRNEHKLVEVGVTVVFSVGVASKIATAGEIAKRPDRTKLKVKNFRHNATLLSNSICIIASIFRIVNKKILNFVFDGS